MSNELIVNGTKISKEVIAWCKKNNFSMVNDINNVKEYTVYKAFIGEEENSAGFEIIEENIDFVYSRDLCCDNETVTTENMLCVQLLVRTGDGDLFVFMTIMLGKGVTLDVGNQTINVDIDTTLPLISQVSEGMRLFKEYLRPDMDNSSMLVADVLQTEDHHLANMISYLDGLDHCFK